MRVFILVFVLVALAACGNRNNNTPARTTQATSLNLGATVTTPAVHINPQGDAGAINLQIGNARVHLPGEDERGERAVQQATGEGTEAR